MQMRGTRVKMFLNVHAYRERERAIAVRFCLSLSASSPSNPIFLVVFELSRSAKYKGCLLLARTHPLIAAINHHHPLLHLPVCVGTRISKKHHKVTTLRWGEARTIHLSLSQNYPSLHTVFTDEMYIRPSLFRLVS